MDEYSRGFEDALTLVDDYMQKYKDKLPEKFVLLIKDAFQEVKDKKVASIKQEFCLSDDEDLSASDKKSKR